MSETPAASPERGEFFQDPPRLPNLYRSDTLLRRYLERVLPPEVRAEIEPELDDMGALAAGELWELALRCLRDEPVHMPFDAWGRRIDEVRVNELWRRCARIAAERGLVAIPYERRHGPWSRVHQMALVYLFDRSSQTYTCPLAMSDGCARTLETLAAPELRDAVFPRLVSRDPERAWTAGQWMTERIGGSDVSRTETVARRGADGRWRLWGTKWFTSAITAEVALALARPEGNPPGSRGLALFLVHARDEAGRLQGIEILRLKDKLGTRQLPTAEIRLLGAPASPVAGLTDGVRNITTVLNLTRTWNAVCATSTIRRGLAWARAYAPLRVAFGGPIAEKPLHVDTLAELAAEHAAAFLLTFRVVELLGESEAGSIDDAGRALLRLLTPVAKLLTGRQAVWGMTEAAEALGGAGYIEDTGVAELVRDAHVFPLWEGTTNVLALETARAIARTDALKPYREDLGRRAAAVREPGLRGTLERALAAAEHAEAWWTDPRRGRGPAAEAELRRFAVTLGRAYATALVCEQAQWELERYGDRRLLEAARRLAARGIDRIRDDGADAEAIRALALD